jgi:hypothetical protein
MSLNQTSATEKAKRDLAKRAGVAESDIETVSVEETDFPDMSLGATVERRNGGADDFDRLAH